MKLTTRNGQLDLPRDFRLTMERTNPFLSGKGDASVPVPLPSSTKSLAALGHRERIDRAEKYVNKVDAMLEVGPIRKLGQLVMDSVHRTDGIDASFAIDNSDLYARSLDKTLKEIFNDYNVEYGNMNSAIDVMQRVYDGADADFMVFPVAVSPYEDNGTKRYQFNNQVVRGELVWEAIDPDMIVHEGDTLVSVPDGYSVAPFLKLSRLVELLFSILGYQVTSSCLTDWPYHRLVIVHNCSDCLCNPTVTLYYRDLVPSCTLNDFLTWLNNKFHVQPVVDSSSKHVRIVAMETMLAMAADMDITPIAEGDFTMQLGPSRRVVLTPTNSIEGTEPAAKTFDKLLQKYEDGYVEVNEFEFRSLESSSPAVNGGLVCRMTTGMFYALEFDSNAGHQVAKPIGTNHFTYDRANSEETEDFSQSDCIPLMLCDSKPDAAEVMPFIGQRQHAHTSFNNSTTEMKQDIIVVQAVADDAHFTFKTMATTQKVLPYKLPENGKYFLELGFGLTPYDLYDACWRRYNNILLNHPTRAKGKVKYTVGQVLNMDMTRLKLFKGQRLLPVSLSAPIAAKQGLSEAEFILAKTFVDGIADSAITPAGQSGFKWEVTDNAAAVAQQLWTQMGGGPDFGDIDIPDLNTFVEAHYLRYASYSVHYVGDDLNPGTPEEGDVVQLTRQATFTIHYQEIVEYDPSCSPSQQTFECHETFANRTVTFTFTAVPA